MGKLACESNQRAVFASQSQAPALAGAWIEIIYPVEPAKKIVSVLAGTFFVVEYLYS